MLTQTQPHRHTVSRLPRVLLLALFIFPLLPGLASRATVSAQSTEILPLSQVHAGMEGYARTIFSGDQIEQFDLVVLGVMPNFFGPKQSIILVQLKGAKVEHTGVVAGMSGSPVYLDGKLAGALSLKLGTFTKEAIAGVTPIEDVLASGAQAGRAMSAPQQSADSFATALQSGNAAASRTGLLSSGVALQPIETPLVFSGFQPAALQQFAPQILNYGFVAAQGGTATPRPEDGHLVPGDMAGMVLVQGDASINAACTVTAVRDRQVYLCGHPFMSLGDVQLPMARSRVVMTLASDLESTKIVDMGGVIGTITGDHLTAVTGKLGTGPSMIPMDLTLATPVGEKTLRFEMINHPKLTPLLVALVAFNGLTQNTLYGENNTFHLTGEIRLKGHPAVRIENAYAPSDSPLPDGMMVALAAQSIFTRLYVNPYEVPDVEAIHLRAESVPGRQSFSIQSAWLEKSEAVPGETVRVRVVLHAYRGGTKTEEAAVRVPAQTTHGTALRILISDGDTLTRATRGFSLPGTSGALNLDEIIAAINQERRNDRLYFGLFTSSPTLVWEDQELPNAPLSEINVLNSRLSPSPVRMLGDSLASEASVPLDGPVSGVASLTLHIR